MRSARWRLAPPAAAEPAVAAPSARSWALERYGVAFALEPHAPGVHVPALKAAGKAVGTSTPVLVLPPQSPPGSPPRLLLDSAAILRWVDAQAPPSAPKLFPPAAAQVEALCARFDSGIGVAARSFVYAHALDTHEMAAALAPPTVPAPERFLWRYAGVGYAVRKLMRAGMAISLDNGARALDELRSEFAAVSALLSDGRQYLAGDATGFTAADLTFAALAAPALGVAYGTHPPWAMLQELPRALRDAAEELRATPAGRLALRLWDEERARVVGGVLRWCAQPVTQHSAAPRRSLGVSGGASSLAVTPRRRAASGAA